MAWSKGKAVVWLAETGIYLYKYEKTLWKSKRYGQGYVYRKPLSLTLPDMLTDVVMTYGLSDYNVTCIVSGASLIWRKLESVAANRDEAKEAALWEAGLSEEYVVDVVQQRQGTRRLASWYVAAYPREVSARLYELLRQYVQIERIDVLPAAVSRCHTSQEGTLYIPDGEGIHLVTVEKGSPTLYAYSPTQPDGYCKACDIYGEGAVLVERKDHAFEPLAVSKKIAQSLQMLDVPPIFAFLLA